MATVTKPTAEERSTSRPLRTAHALRGDLAGVDIVQVVAHDDLGARLQTVQSQLDAAEKAEATALRDWEQASGRAILSEASDADVVEASATLEAAKRTSASIRSAIALLTERKADQEAAIEAAQVDKLRQESASAASKQATALDLVANLADQLSAAVDVVLAQSSVLGALHSQLAASDPERADEIDQDYRDALMEIGHKATQRRTAIAAASAQARYRLQDDGTNRALDDDIPLLDDAKVPKGVRLSAGRAAVVEWEVGALAKLDQDLREEQQNAWEENCARSEVAGMGHLPVSVGEIREAAGLDLGVLALVIPDEEARNLIGLTRYLPASANEGIRASQPTFRSATEARISEQALQAGREALTTLGGI